MILHHRSGRSKRKRHLLETFTFFLRFLLRRGGFKFLPPFCRGHQNTSGSAASRLRL